MIPAPREEFETVWNGATWRAHHAPAPAPTRGRPSYVLVAAAKAEYDAARMRRLYAKRRGQRLRARAARIGAKKAAEAARLACLWALLASPVTVAEAEAALVAAGCAGVVRNSVATRFSKAVRAGIVEAVIVGNRGRAGVYRRAPAYAACVTFPQIGRDPRHRKGQA